MIRCHILLRQIRKVLLDVRIVAHKDCIELSVQDVYIVTIDRRDYLTCELEGDFDWAAKFIEDNTHHLDPKTGSRVPWFVYEDDCVDLYELQTLWWDAHDAIMLREIISLSYLRIEN